MVNGSIREPDEETAVRECASCPAGRREKFKTCHPASVSKGSRHAPTKLLAPKTPTQFLIGASATPEAQ